MSNFLYVEFQGYFACRIATDPDPTDEPRGMSGYTMALTKEDPLDQVIRLQIDRAYLQKNARPPLQDMFKNREFLLGVRVRTVRYGADPGSATPYLPGIAALGSLPVNLNGADAPLQGTAFDSRNIITGNDDAMAFVVYPFNLSIGNPSDPMTCWITISEWLDPPYTYTDPGQYAERLSTLADGNAHPEQIMEVSEAIGVYDPYAYFLARRRYLQKLIDDAATQPPSPELDARVQGYKSRIRQIDFWGDRMNSKLVTRCNWDFDLRGSNTLNGAGLNGRVLPGQPWHAGFWFGGWDGDLLIGYMRGRLDIPFQAA